MTFRVRWFPEVAEARVAAGADRGLKSAAERLLDRANEHVPMRVGTLRDTGHVSVLDGVAVVAYDTVYAARLHEHPEYHFEHQGEGKWLERAVNEAGPEIAAEIAKEMVF